MSATRYCAAWLAAAAVAACQGSPEKTVTITSPASGDTIRGSAVHVTLAVSGVALAPAAEQRPGTAHHHLFLDVDPGPAQDPIPLGVPGIVHLGQGETSFHWEGVAPGQHRIIALLGDPAHVPLQPVVADTVTVVVITP